MSAASGLGLKVTSTGYEYLALRVAIDVNRRRLEASTAPLGETLGADASPVAEVAVRPQLVAVRVRFHRRRQQYEVALVPAGATALDEPIAAVTVAREVLARSGGRGVRPFVERQLLGQLADVGELVLETEAGQ